MQSMEVATAMIFVIIVYNATPKKIEHVNTHEQVNALLERAIREFDIRNRPHVYALFRLNGEEVPTNISVSAAGIQSGTELILREKQASGG